MELNIQKLPIGYTKIKDLVDGINIIHEAKNHEPEDQEFIYSRGSIMDSLLENSVFEDTSSTFRKRFLNEHTDKSLDISSDNSVFRRLQQSINSTR